MMAYFTVPVLNCLRSVPVRADFLHALGDRCPFVAEADDTLTADEKAIARFQKQRMKDFGGENEI